jgi:hypothetical protein
MLNMEALLRSVFGNSLDREERTLELKVGQIVKGVLLEMLSENEALFRMNGITIRAQLEAAVRPGRETWFQVQTSATSGQIALKVLPSSASMDGGKAILEMFGMKSNELNKSTVMALLENGMPVTKDSISSIQQTIRHLPHGVLQDTAIKTGIVILQRGLPAASAAANAVAAALGSADLWNTSWDALRQGLEKWILPPVPSVLQGSKKPTSPAPQFQLQTQAFTSEIQSQGLAKLASQLKLPFADIKPATTSQTMPPAPTLSISTNASPLSNTGTSSAIPIASAASSLQQPSVTPVQVLEALNRLEETAQKVIGNYMPSDTVKLESTSSPTKGDYLRQWLQSLGLLRNDDMVRNPNTANLERQTTVQGGVAATGQPPLESLKNMLAQLLQLQDVPASVREPAQQLLNQTIGHQIISLPHQSDAHVQMMLQLPFSTGQGEMATIYVQSRQRKGEPLSIEQCRLFFHLQMNHMGETWVDVDIHNRSIDVKVMSNHPELEQLVVKQVDSLKDGLNQHGYQIRNVKTSALPTKHDRAETLGENTQNFSDRYRGVDFRV